MNEVWVVLAGEAHSGLSIRSVWTSKDDATEAALNVQYFEGPWVLDGQADRWTRWTSGYDVLVIEKWEVK